MKPSRKSNQGRSEKLVSFGGGETKSNWQWVQYSKMPIRPVPAVPRTIVRGTRTKVERTPRETWIYARVNTVGKENGLEQQIQRCEIWARAHNWQITAIVKEIGSSTQIDRLKLRGMMEGVRRARRSRLLIADSSRLSRLDFGLWESWLEAVGCELVVLDPVVSLAGVLDDCLQATRHILHRPAGRRKQTMLMTEISRVMEAAA